MFASIEAKLISLGALLLIGGVGAVYYGHTRYDAGELAGNTKVAQLTAQHAQQLQHLAELSAAAADAARDAEHQQAKALAAIGARYEQDKTHAKEQADRVIADLRAGTLRLRQQWTCAPAATAAQVPGAAAATGRPDGDAELRATGAGDLVRLAAQCDAQVRGLQAALQSR